MSQRRERKPFEFLWSTRRKWGCLSTGKTSISWRIKYRFQIAFLKAVFFLFMLPWQFLERCVGQTHTLEQTWRFGTFCQQRHFLFPSKVPTDDALASPPVFLHQWVISLSTFCLHTLQVLMPLWDVQHEAEAIFGIKTTWQYFLCVDFFQDFPSLFVFFPHVSLNVMLHHIYKLAWFTDQVNFPLTARPGTCLQIFQIFKFPSSYLQWERVMSSGDEE